MQTNKIGKVKTPRCEKCNKVEFENKVYLGYVYGDKVSYGAKYVMCKDCELKQKVIAKTEFEKPIYQRF